MNSSFVLPATSARIMSGPSAKHLQRLANRLSRRNGAVMGQFRILTESGQLAHLRLWVDELRPQLDRHGPDLPLEVIIGGTVDVAVLEQPLTSDQLIDLPQERERLELNYRPLHRLGTWQRRPN